jgi:hypothetical protein
MDNSLEDLLNNVENLLSLKNFQTRKKTEIVLFPRSDILIMKPNISIGLLYGELVKHGIINEPPLLIPASSESSLGLTIVNSEENMEKKKSEIETEDMAKTEITTPKKARVNHLSSPLSKHRSDSQRKGVLMWKRVVQNYIKYNIRKQLKAAREHDIESDNVMFEPVCPQPSNNLDFVPPPEFCKLVDKKKYVPKKVEETTFSEVEQDSLLPNLRMSNPMINVVIPQPDSDRYSSSSLEGPAVASKPPIPCGLRYDVTHDTVDVYEVDEMTVQIINAVKNNRINAAGFRCALGIVEGLVAMIEEPRTWKWRLCFSF